MILIDPTPSEMKEAASEITLALMPNLGETSHLSIQGTLEPTLLQECITMLMEACRLVYEQTINTVGI